MFNGDTFDTYTCKIAIEKTFAESAGVKSAYSFLRSILSHYSLRFNPVVLFDENELARIIPYWQRFLNHAIKELVYYNIVTYETVRIGVRNCAGETTHILVPQPPQDEDRFINGERRKTKKDLVRDKKKNKRQRPLSYYTAERLLPDGRFNSIGMRCLIAHEQEKELIETALKASRVASEPIVSFPMQPNAYQTNDPLKYAWDAMSSTGAASGVRPTMPGSTDMTAEQTFAKTKALIDELNCAAYSAAQKMNEMKETEVSSAFSTRSTYAASLDAAQSAPYKVVPVPQGCNNVPVSLPSRPTDIPAIIATYRRVYFMAMGVEMFAQDSTFRHDYIPPEFRQFVGKFPDLLIALNELLMFASKQCHSEIARRAGGDSREDFPYFYLEEYTFKNPEETQERFHTIAGHVTSASIQSETAPDKLEGDKKGKKDSVLSMDKCLQAYYDILKAQEDESKPQVYSMNKAEPKDFIVKKKHNLVSKGPHAHCAFRIRRRTDGVTKDKEKGTGKEQKKKKDDLKLAVKMSGDKMVAPSSAMPKTRSQIGLGAHESVVLALYPNH